MTTKKTRIKHAPEFKAEALKLAEKIGVTAAARQLSLYESQIYGWRKAVKKDAKISDRERELAIVRISVIANACFGLFRTPEPALFIFPYFYSKCSDCATFLIDSPPSSIR